MYDATHNPSFSLRFIRAAPLAVAAALMTAPSVASAEPIDEERSYSRTTVVPIDRYHRETRIVRERSSGKDHVKFSATAQPIESAARLVFEIRSERGKQSVVRWTCTAERNVAECFSRPVRVRYLPDDERVVLSVRIAPAPDHPVIHYAAQ